MFRATGTNTYDCFPQGKGTKNKILEFVTIPGGKPHPSHAWASIPRAVVATR